MPPLVLLRCQGGTVVLPDETLVLCDRLDGGNLIVNPPRAVWDRSELSADELTMWTVLVAATGRAMLDVLPQLEGGCINYWDAGNWALNEAADPAGPKRGPQHRRVHLHLIGRSRNAKSPAMKWGEAPAFPLFAERFQWAAGNERLKADECAAITSRARQLMMDRYGVSAADSHGSRSQEHKT
jgi:hypothetical protein